MGMNRARRDMTTKPDSKDANARTLEKLNQSSYDVAIKNEIGIESIRGKNKQFAHKPFCCDIGLG